MDEKSYRYKPSNEWWTILSTLLRSLTEEIKQNESRLAPHTTRRGHKISPAEQMHNRKVIRAAQEADKKKFVDRRKGKLRHGGCPRPGFIDRQVALDKEKYNSPKSEAIDATDNGS